MASPSQTKAAMATATHTLPTLTETLIPTPTSTPTPSWNGIIPPGARMRLGNGRIFKLALSPDGDSVLLAGSVGLSLYSLDTLQLQWSIPTDYPIAYAAFSPDGTMIAAMSMNREVALWDTSDGHFRKTVVKANIGLGNQSGYHEGNHVVFSPDGKVLAFDSGDGVALWDISSGELIRKMTTEQRSINCIAFSPDGKTLAVGSGPVDSTAAIFFWDTDTGNPLPTQYFQGAGDVTHIVYAPDGKTFAFDTGVLNLADAASGKILWTVITRLDLLDLNFSPDGKSLVSGDSYGGVIVWNTGNGSRIRTLAGHSDYVTGAAFTPDGKEIVSGSLDGTVVLWNAASGARLHTLEENNERITSIDYSPDGQMMVSGNSDGTVNVWDLSSGKRLLNLKGHTESVTGVAISPDGKMLASSSMDESVILWNASNGAKLWTLPSQGTNCAATSVAFVPGEKSLASASACNALFFWGISGGTKLRSITFGPSPSSPAVFNLIFSADGKKLALQLSSLSDESIAILEMPSGKTLKSIDVSLQNITRISLSPDGNTVATIGFNGFTLWDVNTGVSLQTLTSVFGSDVAFSPDGKTIAIAGFDQNSGKYAILLYDVARWELIRTLTGHSDSVTDMAFSSDGKTLASGSDDGTIILWDLGK